MSKKRKHPNLKGCPACGCERKIVVSGFVVCGKCNYKFGDGGLGNQTLRRQVDGELYNAADYSHGGRLPNADEQVRTPQPRGRPYRSELK